jgi:hypothetical protein
MIKICGISAKIGVLMNTSTKVCINNHRVLIFSAIAFSLSLIGAILRLVCLLFFYDKIGYYQTGAVLPVVSAVFYAASIVFFAIVARFLVKPSAVAAHLSKPARIAAILPLAAIVVHLFSICGTVFGGEATWYEVFLLVFGVISAVFFASLVFCRQPSSLSALSGIGCIFWLALAAMRSYLDFFVPMNSPDKLFFQLGAVGATLLVFSEIRAIYNMPQPRAYVFCFFTGVFTVASASIPNIIANANDVFANYTLLFEDIVMLSILVYATVRLLCGALSDQNQLK